MHKFEYHQPGSVSEACTLLRNYGGEAKLLAGGTDLLVKFRKGMLQPQHVLDVKKIPGLDFIGFGPGGLEIGAAVTMYETEKFLSGYPQLQVLAQAIHSVASCQIRNRATVVGNVCNASPAADTVPALVVLAAVVKVRGVAGERCVPVAEFFAGPGKSVLQSGEMVTGLVIPAVSPQASGVYLKHSRRRFVDLATVGLAAWGQGREYKIAMAAVAPTVVRALAAEALLAEEGLSIATAAKAAKLAVMSAVPISDVRGSREYRLAMVEVLARRALEALCGGDR